MTPSFPFDGGLALSLREDAQMLEYIPTENDHDRRLTCILGRMGLVSDRWHKRSLSRTLDVTI